MFLSLGFTGYFIAQGLQFFGLFYLPPITVTFILNLTPIFVVLLSVLFLKEKPSSIQSLGMIITLFGVLVFFYDSLLLFKEFVGILLTLISGVGWAGYMIISRYYLREGKETVIVLTAFSMLLGSLMLLGTTALTGNITAVSYNGWVIILWLSVVNTAVAFTLWNNALKTLRVYEQSILQNTMLIQISLLTLVFLHEMLSPQKILGLAMVFIGVLVVQLGKR
jgi:drug/metabolite transporter (DMT)-like permease